MDIKQLFPAVTVGQKPMHLPYTMGYISNRSERHFTTNYVTLTHQLRTSNHSHPQGKSKQASIHRPFSTMVTPLP